MMSSLIWWDARAEAHLKYYSCIDFRDDVRSFFVSFSIAASIPSRLTEQRQQLCKSCVPRLLQELDHLTSGEQQNSGLQ